MQDPSAARLERLPARLVVVRVGTGASGIAAALDRLEEAAGTGDRLGVMIDARGADAVEQPQQGRVAQVRRLRALRPAMQRYAAGVAFLTAPADLGEQRRRARAARLLLGCPVEAFDAEHTARRWLAEHGVDAGSHDT